MGVRENTVVLYTSDHGEHFNYRAKNNKTTGHDDSIRIPMILSGPAHCQLQESCKAPLASKMGTTLLELCDVATPGDLHGKSLAPLATGAQTEGAATYYVQNVEDFRSYAEWEGTWLVFIRAIRALIFRPQRMGPPARVMDQNPQAGVERTRRSSSI